MSKNILITGASKGIGKEIALTLKNEGHNIFITARNENLLIETAKEIGAKDYFTCDLLKKDELENLCNFMEKSTIDILVNNAGEYIYEPVEKINYGQIEQIFSTNLLAPTYLCSKAAKLMKQKKWGRIINIGSISGVMGEAYASLYSGSKSGLIGLTKALALELAQDNITVNTINPGWVYTQLGRNSIEDSDFSFSETLETIPQKRFVEPNEVAKLVSYLVSEDAKGITGQSINLCAGLSVGI